MMFKIYFDGGRTAITFFFFFAPNNEAKLLSRTGHCQKAHSFNFVHSEDSADKRNDTYSSDVMEIY